jgi:dienelactone hydrolase
MKFYVFALLVALAALPCAAQLSDVQHPNEQTQNDQAQKGAPPWVATGQQAIQEMAGGQFDKVEAEYDPKMTAANPPGRLAGAWGSILKQEGAFESVVGVRAGKVKDLDVALFTCKFDKALVDVEIVFNSDGKIAGLHFGQHQNPMPSWTAPSYAQPSSFTETPLDLVNGAFDLPGTLTMPNGNGPFPAVVLLQDSGPHDEDETVGADKPLKDLAWGLASHGIAVYRFTKRTAKYGEKSNADPSKLTVDDEVISDARAAVGLVAKQPKVDASRIYLVGCGFGGYLAPRIATGDDQIAGIVAMAANSQPLEKDLLAAAQFIAKEDAAETQAAAADKPSLAPKTPGSDATPAPPAKPSAADEQLVARAEDSAKQIDSPALKPGDTVPVLGGTMPAGYWLDLRNYDPVQTAERLRIPLFFLQGGRDFQVSPDRDFKAWQTALAHRRNVTLKLYPDLDHIFVFGTGPLLQGYSKPSHVDEQVITDVSAWISAGGKSSAVTASAK